MQSPEIRLLKEHEEFRQCESIQKSIWGGLSVAAEVMVVTQKFGGVVLGAFEKRKLVGFLYAFMARRKGQIIHWSHMMGTLPEYRGQGLGFRMKLFHRDLALRHGIRSICWTYDPLQSRNAGLNLGRLGARVEEYVVDCYGRFPSTIERGLPSDRLIVSWQIASEKIKKCLEAQGTVTQIPDAPRINLTASNNRGFLVNRRIDLELHDRSLLLEVPSNTDLMRKEALALATRWRLQARDVFLHYFSEGHRVDRFLTENLSPEQRRCFYHLRQRGH